MEVDLLKHNQEAFQEINKMIESEIKKIAAPRATGSGKTYLMGALAEKYNDDKKLVLEPTRPLLDSIKEKFDEFGIVNTDFITYQKLIHMSDEDIAKMDYKLIFLDECHHGVAPVWGTKIDCLMKTHLDSIIFGTSATTVRNDGVNVVETLFDNNAIGELPLSIAIARKVLPCPHYITAIYRLDDEFEKLKKRVENSTNTKTEKKEFYKKMQEMKLHFEKSYGVPLILNKYIKVRNGKYLVFCRDKKHLDAMRNVVIDWFKTAGIKDVHSYAVYSDYPDKEKDYKDFCEDNSDTLKILFSINMLNEGCHIKNISGVLMLRTTQSNLIYLQQLGRLVESGNMDKYLLVFDFVNNFSSVNDGIGLLKEIKDAVAKEKASDPDFDDSEFENIDTFFVIDQVVEIQEMFREIEGRLEGSWDLYIKALKQYKEREGDCLVPKGYIEMVDDANVKLGQWVRNIRSTKKCKTRYLLTKERIKQLEDLGFVWDVRIIDDLKWEENFEKLCKYKDEYGNLFQIKDKELSKWCTKQRVKMRAKEKQYQSNVKELEGWKIEKLNSIGFCWESLDEAFLYQLEKLKKYYETHNKFMLINRRENDKLSSWCTKIRNDMKNGRLEEWKVEKLNEIGFPFDPNKAYFEAGCNYYIKVVSNIKNVPKNYVTEDGFNLGSWVASQRNKNRRNVLNDYEKYMLKNIGFNFNINSSKYDMMIGLLKEYVEINNCDFNIKQSTIYKGEKLGEFVSSVRERYKKNKLSKDKIEKLNAIGFIWNVNEWQWNDNLDWFKKNKTNHEGKICISKCDISVKYYYDWLITQKLLYRKGEMREDRRKLFEQVIMS